MRRRSVDTKDRAVGGAEVQGLKGCTGEGGHHPESHGRGLSWGQGVNRPTFLRDGSVT